MIAWLEAERDRCYTSAIVIAQLAYCVRRTAGSGKTLQAWLTRLMDALHGRIHGFNVSVAHVWAERERLLEKAGQRMAVEELYRGNGATTRIDDRCEERPRLQATRAPSLQPVHGTPIGSDRLPDGLTRISGSEQEGEIVTKHSQFTPLLGSTSCVKSSSAAIPPREADAARKRPVRGWDRNLPPGNAPVFEGSERRKVGRKRAVRYSQEIGSNKRFIFSCLEWRRGWDSNPRAGDHPTSRFRGGPVTTTSVPLRRGRRRPGRTPSLIGPARRGRVSPANAGSERTVVSRPGSRPRARRPPPRRGDSTTDG